MTEGLKTYRSTVGAKETADRLAAAATKRGLRIFARIDHAAGAAEAGLALRPTELLIFGAARGGTPMMQAAQTAGIDLPLKALVWEDETGGVWLSYNEPQWMARRHGAAPATASSLALLLAALAAEAVG
jgi:uncharacterized protein (DUF302 family)